MLITTVSFTDHPNAESRDDRLGTSPRIARPAALRFRLNRFGGTPTRF
jgi:hypothetical protein